MPESTIQERTEYEGGFALDDDAGVSVSSFREDVHLTLTTSGAVAVTVTAGLTDEQIDDLGLALEGAKRARAEARRRAEVVA